MASRFKKWLSALIDNYRKEKPGEVTFGVSCDDSVTFKELPNVARIEKVQRKSWSVYELRNDVGGFEMIGYVRNGNGRTLYQIKHTLTGTVINLSKDNFNLLFERKKQ